ncbi:M15 family metallopeptidase [Microbacterium sp. cf046]|uniref:M15 family metallopeptidase n=1 Tax=Microbacterium sp. cf046 TaxID=1761803 RepID=UPI0020C9037F|nr:D-alanyl-D-alanine carboxypeptidase family protein [Microbacterium sp. cf046]
MTAPEPHNPPLSRRAARLQRERDDERALAADPVTDAAPSQPAEASPDEPREVLSHTVPLPVIADPEPDVTPDSAPAREVVLGAAAPLRSRTPGRRSSTGPTPIRVGARRSAPAPTRRAAKTAELMAPRSAPARHARGRSVARIGVVAGLAVVGSLVLGSAATVTAAVTGGPLFGIAAGRAAEVRETIEPAPTARLSVPLPAPAEAIPAPTVEAAPAALELCAMPAFTAALAAGDDAGAIAAAGGAVAFRTSVAEGTAPCVALDDPARVWVVINKTRPLVPVDHFPGSLATPEGVRSTEGGTLRSDAAAALSTMVGAASSAGVGEIALESGFRSYSTQQATYSSQVSAQGVAEADLSSARPGFSEHQSGLAGDLVACADGCGTLDDLGASIQGQWIVAHSWEFGWITRYEDGYTPITGYTPEPWHLRYIGVDLARAYHEGGWHTLEEFFGLPAAPTYLQ